MNEVTDEELINTADLTPAEFDALENRLRLKAAVLGWTGDPLHQPLPTVAAIVRGILAERER
jgi:hypothetical protein